jgi:hypothetical protein
MAMADLTYAALAKPPQNDTETTEPGFTPGPWKSDEKIVPWLSGDAPAVAVWYENKTRPGHQSPVCMVAPDLSGRYGVAGSQHPIEDARLIAAAPEMYEALQQAAQAIPTTHGAFETVRAALAKAVRP